MQSTGDREFKQPPILVGTSISLGIDQSLSVAILGYLLSPWGRKKSTPSCMIAPSRSKTMPEAASIDEALMRPERQTFSSTTCDTTRLPVKKCRFTWSLPSFPVYEMCHWPQFQSGWRLYILMQSADAERLSASCKISQFWSCNIVQTSAKISSRQSEPSWYR